MAVAVGPPTVTIHYNDEFCVSELNANMSSTKEEGYFAADTRLVSGYRLKLGREYPELLNGAAVEQHSARFEFTNPRFLGNDGTPIREHTIHLRLDRTIGPGMHEDYDLSNHAREPVTFTLEVSVESDFSDLFDVKAHRRVVRGSIHSFWDDSGTLTTRYVNGPFERAFVLQVANNSSEPEFANGGIRFPVTLSPKEHWHTCLFWMPVIDGEQRPVARPCHHLLADESDSEGLRLRWIQSATIFDTENAIVTESLAQATKDLAGLRLHRHDEIAQPDESDDSWVPSAGIPWFVSLFGRDALTVAYQTLSLSPRFALGSLRALAALQGDGYDDARDMQPGKIEHEIRHGELAQLHLIPHTPYYGTHEATTLYVIVAATAWRWHGDDDAIKEIRPSVERALEWIGRDGDVDQDGLQEYQTRSPVGYYNQGWKDSGDAILTADGELAKLPIALCEHQGLVVAAKRAWAGVLEDAFEEGDAARRLRDEADALVEQIEARFWWEEEGTYYLGLDGDKKPIESVASNPGHLLYHRAIDATRAKKVARRLLEDDMWSGWGIRTLSHRHVAYDPLSYQLGSVWPHDNAIIAEGFRAYGLDEEAQQIAQAIFAATSMFASYRPPELFAGFPRDPGAFPVQYLGANVPQAWSSGALVQLITTLLGLDADAPRKRLRVRPALPDWMPVVTVRQLRVGSQTIAVRVARLADGEHELDVLSDPGGIEIDFQPMPAD
ncbi:MAG: glycogen debranching N-terminal domain-containing protein [Acidimicrobiales bacterium]